jgi:hypothetical protein
MTATTPQRRPGSPGRPRPAPGRTRAAAPTPLRVLFVVLVLYAAFGKGFAYAGWPPVFVGEVVLALMTFAVLRPGMAVPRNVASTLTVALIGLALVQFAVDRLTAADPVLETLRGLAPIYYSAYAFLIFALLRRYERRVGYAPALAAVQDAVARAVPAVVLAVLVLAGLLVYRPGVVPTWPGSGVSMLITGSSIAVTLVLCLPFLGVERRGNRLVIGRRLLALAWALTAVLLVFRSRGALLGLAAGAFALRPRAIAVTRALLAASVLLVGLYVSGASVQVGSREVSFQAAVASTASLLGSPEDDEIGQSFLGTRTWRSEWWDDIWSDVTSERMVLHGHGWGDNLALRYDVVPPIAADEPRVLRLPHSLFFSLAGRAGLVMAVGFMLVPILTVAPTYRRGTRRALPVVEAVRGGIVATLVVALVDIFVEAPQGGILLWGMVGFLWWVTAPHRDATGEQTAGEASAGRRDSDEPRTARMA